MPPSQCVCDWGNKCQSIQKRLQAWCVENDTNHVALGYYQCRSTDQGHPLRESIAKHLNPKSKAQTWIVARHHWPIALLLANGNKEQTIQVEGGDFVVLPKIVGNNGRVRTFNTSLTRAEAVSSGIIHRSEQLSVPKQDTSDDSSGKIAGPAKYVQAPLAPFHAVKEYVDGLGSARAARKRNRVSLESLIPADASTPAAVTTTTSTRQNRASAKPASVDALTPAVVAAAAARTSTMSTSGVEAELGVLAASTPAAATTTTSTTSTRQNRASAKPASVDALTPAVVAAK